MIESGGIVNVEKDGHSWTDIGDTGGIGVEIDALALKIGDHTGKIKTKRFSVFFEGFGDSVVAPEHIAHFDDVLLNKWIGVTCKKSRVPKLGIVGRFIVVTVKTFL